MRYTVLTYIFNNYDSVKEIPVIDPSAEYILITDSDSIKSDTWNIIIDHSLDGLSVFDKCYHVRFHPFNYSHTDICLRIDGSIRIKSSLSRLIDRFEETNADIALMVNPVFNYLHEDYPYWIKNRNYPQENAQKCLSFLKSLGYDETYRGYYQANFVIERRNCLTKEIDDRSYQMLRDLGEDGVIERFDQPIWSFVINKYMSDKLKVMAVDEYLITFSKYFQLCFHDSNEPIPFKMNMKPPYLFDRLVRCEDFDYLKEPWNIKEKLRFLKRKYFPNIRIHYR